MAKKVFKLTHKGIMARWVLQFMSEEPTAEYALLQLLEAAGLGEAFIKRTALEGSRLSDELAWTLFGLAGTAEGTGEQKFRWLPVGGNYPEREAARVILEVLPEDGTSTARADELIDAGFTAGFSGEPFCRTASWMVETCPRTLESEDSILRVFCTFWDSRLKAAGK